ncbi:MAG: diaminopimelate epimerase [Methylotenera sp.]
MLLYFTKMQGAGNDFVVVDSFTSPITLTSEQIKKIADRHFGVGCDQLLIVEKTSLPNVDFKYRIFNADGGEVEQCGNGARCFVRFVREKGLTQKSEIVVETASGLITLTLCVDNQVTVNMGAPIFEPAKIPFTAEKRQKTYALQTNTRAGAGRALSIDISAVSMGNPHAVTIVDDVDTANVAELGPQIEAHASFPQRVNAGFMQILNAHSINLRVYERGAGETLSCGTGACAAAVSGIQLELLQSPVLVNTRGGKLQITWAGETEPVMMTGAAEIVFDGQIEI